MSLRKQTASLALTAGLVLGATGAQANCTAEVLHWWTSGGEAKAVGELKKAFEADGCTWIDSPIAGGGGDAAMTALRARVVAGNPPTAVQLKGAGHSGMGRRGCVERRRRSRHERTLG